MTTEFRSLSQGAEVQAGGGVHYRTWAPGKSDVSLVIYDSTGRQIRRFALNAEGDGYFSGTDSLGKAVDRYKYAFDGGEWPDPASRANPDGVHAPAQVVDPSDFIWHDQNWRPPFFSDLIIYELHVGAFTPAGTFRSAIERLGDLVRLGVNAIELMPVADFPGARNWGYDGVLPYAPARAYGSPNELRQLVDAAHARGLAVILDVVYNHLGPDGNYLGVYSRDYFNPAHKTPWGDGFNFELRPAREFFLQNPGYWQKEFHIDGFRLDATHAIADSSKQHFVAEIAERIHSLGGFVMAEDERNEPRFVESPARGGMGLDARWADDFHHVLRVMLTGEREGYYRAYRGTPDELETTLRDGWLLHGEKRKRKSAAGASACAKLAPDKFVFCISNHDQVGNEAFGTRVSEKISPAKYRAASVLLCLAPYTPLLFMGQEWAATTPFQFFTDHEPQLGAKITAGRREEFRGFAAFSHRSTRAKIPDPQAAETFLRSKLRWEEQNTAAQAATLRLYQEVLRLRRTLPALQNRARENWRLLRRGDDVVRLIYGKATGERCVIMVCFARALPKLKREGWRLLLSTNESRFCAEREEPPGAEARVYLPAANS